MDYSKLSEKIKKLANGDNAEQVSDVLNDVTSYETAGTELENSVRQLQDENQKLRDTNMSLFLRVTGDTGPDSQDEAPEPTLDDFVKSLSEEMKKEN